MWGKKNIISPWTESFLQSVEAQTEIGETMRLDYYLTQNDRGMYGISIKKFIKQGPEYIFTEEKTDSLVTYLKDEIDEICNKIIRNTVTPCTLNDVIKDMEIF